MAQSKFSISRHNQAGYSKFELPRMSQGGSINDPYGLDSEANLSGSTFQSEGQGNQNVIGQSGKSPNKGLSSGASGALKGVTSSLQGENGSYIDPNAANSAWFQNQSNKRKNADKAADTAAKAALAIPVYGEIAGAAIEIGKTVGDVSQNKYGIYKSKLGQVADNNFNPIKAFQQAGQLLSHPTVSGLINESTDGLFGKDASQQEAIRQKKILENKNNANQISATTIAGNQSRQLIGGYEAPAYGKKGMKLKGRKMSKFSVC